MNRWKIPRWLEDEVRTRDGRCIYCGVEFGSASTNRREKPSWEHIVNDESIVTRENIALCCVGCNSSKGAKPLIDWVLSNYCVTRGITLASVAPIARAALNSERARNDDHPSLAAAVDGQDLALRSAR